VDLDEFADAAMGHLASGKIEIGYGFAEQARRLTGGTGSNLRENERSTRLDPTCPVNAASPGTSPLKPL
jgi:hypothetical protein